MKIILLGSTGQVGIELLERLSTAQFEVISLSRNDCDLSNPDSIFSSLSQFSADLIINAAAYTAVDKAEEEQDIANKINGLAVGELAKYCQFKNIPLIHFSTDYVFDGQKTEGYLESDTTNPISAYGKSKLLGEQLIQQNLKHHLIVRVSWVFSKNRQNFVKTILNLANTREELRIVADQWGCPTAAQDIARVIEIILTRLKSGSFDEWGIYHYASNGPTNWYEFASDFLRLAQHQGRQLSLKTLTPINTDGYPTKAQRPKNSVLITDKIEKTFNLSREAWHDYLAEVIEKSASLENIVV